VNVGATPDHELLEAARIGDGEAFRALVAPHVRALHLHCYRMLASYHDAEEAMQEVLLRAWRSLGTYEGRAPLRHWLYRIATTACLKLIAARTRRPATVTDLDYLQPYPDRLLDDLGPGADPAAEAERRESVSLAFIAALQLLPASQRAALVLHDVLGWRSDEIADLLDTSVPAVNSALQRARASVGRAGEPRRSLDTEDRRVLARFIDAWHRGDVAGLAAVLREDVVLRMPPEAMEFAGRDDVVGFFATVPGGGRFDTIRLVATRANGQLALAAFEPDADGVPQPYGLMVLDLDGGLVSGITGFPATPGRTIDAAFDLQPA
jgi:RNA polymerase sigma-70 factor, ECF subfamily